MQRKLLFSFILTASGLVGSIALGQTPQSTQPGGAAGGPSRPGDVTDQRSSLPQAGLPQDAQQVQSKMDDKKFLKDAAIGGMTDVELGKLAAQKASSEGVKQFAQKMVDDHSKATEEVKQLATQMNITIPDALDSKHQSRVEKLSKLSGTEFDRAYLKQQLKDHEKNVKEFQRASQDATDPNVKALAAKLLPTLQQHLAAVKELNSGTSATSMNRPANPQ